MNRNRKSMIALTAFLTLGLGTLAIEGAPVCERLVKTFKDKRVKNRVSPKTLAAWQLWGKGHPDFKPHYRPKYKNTREEVVEKVAFACEVPKIPQSPPPEIITEFLPVEFPPVQVDLPPPGLPPVEEIAFNNETPPLPFVPPYSPGTPTEPPSPVPEPSSLLLLGTGGAFLILLVGNSRSRARI
jgi:hypothetical protein